MFKSLMTGILISTSMANAIAAGSTVFGLGLGAPLDLPQCDKRGRNSTVCWESTSSSRSNQSDLLSNGSVTIRFPIGETPSIVSGGALIGQIIDGNLEGVGFNTRGVNNADFVLAELKNKYGAPSAFVTRVATNGAGVSHKVFDATWRTDGVAVVYQSVTRTFDVGLINIHTLKGAAEQRRQLNELAKDKRPL